MESVEESAGRIAYRLAMGFRTDYAYLENHARQNGLDPKEVLSETRRLCRRHRIDFSLLAFTMPKKPRKVPEKKGRERFAMKGKTGALLGRYAKELPVLSRMGERDKWAKEHGYTSWTRFKLEEFARDLGYRSFGGYEKARVEKFAHGYLALLTNLYRAGVAEPEKLANLVFPQKYSFARKRLAKEAKELAKKPMLYPGKVRH